MKLYRIIFSLIAIVLVTCIVGCGTESQQEESGNSIFSVKEICDNCNQYNHNRITIKGRAKSFYKSDETEYGAYSLILEDIDTKSEVITCYFENDDLQALYTFEGTDYLEENDARRLITISGQFSFIKKESMDACQLTECEVTAISSSLDDLLHQTDESSDIETISKTTKSDSAQDSESKTTITNTKNTYSYSEFMRELKDLLETPEYGIFDEKYYGDPLEGYVLMPHDEQKDILDNGRILMRSLYFQSNKTPDMAIILAVTIENNIVTQIIVASPVYIKSPTLAIELRELLMDFMMIPCGVLERCENRDEIHKLYEELEQSEIVNSLNNSVAYKLNKNTWNATMEVNSVDGTWIIINP